MLAFYIESKNLNSKGYSGVLVEHNVTTIVSFVHIVLSKVSR